MSNHKILLGSVPTAKIQIGNKGSIEIDTASSGGKKTIKLQFTSSDDTVQKEIENVVEEIKSEMGDIESEIENSMDDVKSNQELRFESLQDQREHQREMLETGLGLAIPIIAILGLFTYIIIHTIQKRKWNEALLNKGVSLEEIEKKHQLLAASDSDDLKSFEQKKHLKYAIVFGSLGLAILMGTAMSSFGYFIGFLGLFLGSGFYYFYKKGL